LIEPGCSISAGRNRAIAAATHDVIAVTDAGVILDPEWLERITRPLYDEPWLDVVSGFFRADPHSVFEAAMGATAFPLADEIDPTTFLPSSRSVAFRRSAWARVGGYPEWLDYCEDLVFDLRLKAAGARFKFVPDALVYYRPHSTLTSFFKTYRRYALGDGKADLWRKRHAARYVTYGVVIPLIALLGFHVHRVLWGLYALGGAVYLRQPYRRLRRVLRAAASENGVRVTLFGNLWAIALIPVIRVTGDLAKMIGYPAGVRWRLRRRLLDWRRD
jgi:cellulose synthase/poly-beta-1,6-N-acetylglucosamine synthase-like glycosyltransferase